MAKADTIVLYPAPGMGHMISMVELGKLILKHYSYKFSVLTVVYTTGGLVDTPSIPAYINRVTKSHPSISFQHFPCTTTTNHPDQTHSFISLLSDFIRHNDPNVRLALQELSRTFQVRVFIIDLFCTSAMAIAREFKIPTFYFYTSGTAPLGALMYFPTIHARVKQSFKDIGSWWNQENNHVWHGLCKYNSTVKKEKIYDKIGLASLRKSINKFISDSTQSHLKNLNNQNQ